MPTATPTAIPYVYPLPEEFNVYRSEETLETLRAWLKHTPVPAGAHIDFSASQVMEVDGTGLQLLAAMRRSGYQVRIIDPSPKIWAALQTSGTSDWLNAVELT